MRRVLEWSVLAAAFLCLFMLAYLHVAFIRSPITCLKSVQWPRDGVLRIEIITDPASKDAPLAVPAGGGSPLNSSSLASSAGVVDEAAALLPVEQLSHLQTLTRSGRRPCTVPSLTDPAPAPAPARRSLAQRQLRRRVQPGVRVPATVGQDAAATGHPRQGCRAGPGDRRVLRRRLQSPAAALLPRLRRRPHGVPQVAGREAEQQGLRPKRRDGRTLPIRQHLVRPASPRA